jgi:hypothetical protein
MSYLAIFKRIIPFFLTFAAGLAVASIFVPITAPSFPRSERQGRGRYHKELKRENESLRRENQRMKKELEELRRDALNVEFRNLKWDVPEVTVQVPAVPPPPARVK